MSSNPNQPQNDRLKKRYRRIIFFAARVLLQSWWFELALPKLGLGRVTAKTRIRRFVKVARNFRILAAELGGLMIKVGQFMSSRLDILPTQITRELEGLQDEVAHEDFASILSQLEKELGMPVEKAFASFSETPLAAASLGQVHAATLTERLTEELAIESVVVKVLRPGIYQIVEVDLAALRKVATWLSRVKLISRRADTSALIEEFAVTTYEEIDYLNEAKNLEEFRSNFKTDSYVSAPTVVWERTSRSILTMQNVEAIKISDVNSLVALGIDPNMVAAELARVTFQQIFVNGFFHADPHPGNLFVTPLEIEGKKTFQLSFIDFGMMGRVSEEQQQNLQRFLFALVTRDARGWVEAIKRLNVLLPTADTVQLEIAMDALFERFGGIAVADLVKTDPREFRDFAMQFGELVRALPFQLPENFLLLGRTISIVSGVTSTLNQEFNMWNALDPFARTLLQGGAGSTFTAVARELLDSASTLARLPRRLEALSSRLERGEISIRNPELERRVRRLENSQASLASAIYFAVLLGSGLYLLQQNNQVGIFFLTIASAIVLIDQVRRRLP